ncbi:MAG: NAD(P)-binding domain-containing protein, partial [Rhizobium sp.]|nr:NAD(P)-binding domain-containing protein [Rhizobium sp.]
MPSDNAGARARQIAFLGTGLMGAPMARRLLKAGFAVTVWNRDPVKAEALSADGAAVSPSAADAVRGADIVFTMLSDGKAV